MSMFVGLNTGRTGPGAGSTKKKPKLSMTAFKNLRKVGKLKRNWLNRNHVSSVIPGTCL